MAEKAEYVNTGEGADQDGQKDRPGVKETAREMREDMSMEKVDSKLEETVSDKPLLQHLLDFGVVVRAVVIAAVVALITLLALSATLSGVVLIVVFFAAWIFLGMRDYEKRRPTRDVDEEEEEEDGSAAPEGKGGDDSGDATDLGEDDTEDKDEDEEKSA